MKKIAGCLAKCKGLMLCVGVLAAALVFSVGLSVYAVNKQVINNIGGSARLTVNESGAYVVSYSHSSAAVSRITDEGCDTRRFDTEGEIKNIYAGQGCVYAMCVSGDQACLSCYFFSNDSVYYYPFNNIQINDSYKFCVSNDRVFFAKSGEISTTFYCYSVYGEYLYSFTLDRVTDFAINQREDTLFILSQGKIYTVNAADNSMPLLQMQTDVMYSEIYVTDNTVFDYDGCIADTAADVFIESGIQCGKINGGVVNEYYCRYSEGKIYGYDVTGAENILYSTDNTGNAQMCSLNDNLYLLYDDGTFEIINSNELSFPVIPTVPAENPTASDASTKPPEKPAVPTEQSSGHTARIFAVNSYSLDAKRSIIWDIPAGTTIAQLKNGITADGYDVEIYSKSNVKKTSGKVGTDCTMRLKYNGSKYGEYKLSVLGDLTGEGNISSGDATALSKYFMESTTLTEPQLLAADCNKDGNVTGADLVKLAKNNL